MKARLSDTVGEKKEQKEAEDKREGKKNCNAKSRHTSTL